MTHISPFVTIVLPVYNGENTLSETLVSLLDQSYSNFEILIGIDGTKDRSKDIAEGFNDDRIQIIENETNLGLGPNLNKLISFASKRSKYIAMAEQDDIYTSTRIEKQVAVMEQYAEVGLVSGIAEFISDSGSQLFPDLLVTGNQFPQGVDLFKFLYKKQLKVVNTCMMLRKRVHLDHALVFTDRYPNMNVDWDYVLRFSLVSKVFGIPEKLVTMNRKGFNTSVTTNKKLQHETSRRLLLDFKKEFPDLISESDYKDALKFHRKIELGHHDKLGILLYSISYFLLYFDPYFLKYPLMRIKKFLNKS